MIRFDFSNRLTQVYREFLQLRNYRIFDDANDGEIGVEINYSDETSDEFQLSSLGYHKTIDLRHACDGSNRFARLTHALEKNVAKASSRLATINSTIQKIVHAFDADCQRIGNDVSFHVMLRAACRIQ